MQLSHLPTEELVSELWLAAALLRSASERRDSAAEAQAEDLFAELNAEIGRREAAAEAPLSTATGT